MIKCGILKAPGAKEGSRVVSPDLMETVESRDLSACVEALDSETYLRLSTGATR